MRKPIPQQYIDSLPGGYTLLGWGGDFDTMLFKVFAGLAVDYSRAESEWREGDWQGYSPSICYAAPHDSKIVELNRKAGKLLEVISDHIGNGPHLFKSEDVLSGKDGIISDKKTLIPEDDEERAKYPIGTYTTEYCPNAIVALARHSFEANEKHNPGEEIHWAKEKSVGSINRVFRHLFEFAWHHARGERRKAKYHITAAAWRINELLERYITKMKPFDNDNT